MRRVVHCSWVTALLMASQFLTRPSEVCDFAACQFAAAEEGITYFRSSGGVAAKSEAPLAAAFDPESNLVWKTEVPPGHSTPTIVAGRIVFTTHEAGKLATMALDLKTGKPLWKKFAPANRIEPHHRVGSPATATVAGDGSRLFVFFGSYGLLCYDLDGQLLWSREMGPFQDEFGAASSPILVGDRLILNQDHDVDSFLLALDKKTGEQLWKVPREEFVRSYATPAIMEVDGRIQIIVPGALQLAAYDLQTGEKLWWVNGLARIVNTTPALGENRLFVATWSPGGDSGERISMQPWPQAVAQFDKNGDGGLTREEVGEGPVLNRFFRIDTNQDDKLQQAEWERHAQVFRRAQNAILAIRPGGSGNVTEAAILWKFEKGVPYVASPLLYDGILYLVKDGGIITALDAETGEPIKQGRARGRGNYYASPVAGDGKVYVASERGEITVLRAGRPWKILSSHDFAERIMATPVIHQGKIYVRTEAALYCFGSHPGEGM